MQRRQSGGPKSVISREPKSTQNTSFYFRRIVMHLTIKKGSAKPTPSWQAEVVPSHDEIAQAFVEHEGSRSCYSRSRVIKLKGQDETRCEKYMSR
jgi:hypothetical protein